MSELKRVAFTTLTGGGSAADAAASSSSLSSLTTTTSAAAIAVTATAASIAATSAPTIPPAVPSTSKKTFGSLNAAALLQAQHEPSMSSSTSMLPPPPITVAAAAPSTMTSQSQANRTYRIELELFEPNANSFSEFNYTKLVHVEKKKVKRKQSKLNGFSDPFEENDDDVARLAKELEKKYGSSYGAGTSKGRRSKKDDCYDKGAGYDESDSFIDNTEAYDEYIPEEVETVNGGFYINSGALEFKHLTNYDRTEEVAKVTKSKKRILSISSSSEDYENDNEGEENEAESRADGVHNNNTSVSRDDNTASNKMKNGHLEKKVKVSETDEKDIILKIKKDKKLDKVKTKDNLREDSASSDSNKEKDKEKEKNVKTLTIKDMLKAKRDNFRKMQEEDNKLSLVNGEDGGKDSTDDTTETSSDDSDSENEPDEKKFKRSGDEEQENVKLPDDLTDELRTDIHKFKECVIQSNQSGKSFHFDDNMTEIFLRIDNACLRHSDKYVRNRVFAHLEFQLSLSKNYLLRKAKSLIIKQEKTKTKRAFIKLKKAVAEVMPSIILNYENNCRKAEELRTMAEQSNLENIKQIKNPKKKFIWNDSLRSLFYDLFQVRWASYAALKKQKETFEDYVYNYLKEKVVPIWPVGWMKFEDLRYELGKRKVVVKKPKENKKPGEISHSKKKSNDDITSMLPGKSSSHSSDLTKSVLSNSNSVSVVSTKDLVVTITTKNDKKLDVPQPSAPSNSVTITQIPVEGSSSNNSLNTSSSNASNKSDALLLLSSQQKPHKTNSSTHNNSNNSSNNSPLSLVNQNHVSQKVSGSSSTTSSTKSSKSVSEKTSSNSTIPNNNNNQNSTIIGNSSSRTDKSPTKKATDHSINSIMFTPAIMEKVIDPIDSDNCIPPPTTGPISPIYNLVGSSPPWKHHPSALNKSTNDTATTHIITVDNLKNTSDIINTSNKLINNNNNNNNSSSTNSSVNCGGAQTKEGSIRIRSVANVNSSLEKERKKEKNLISVHNAVGVGNDKVDLESSSESDGVEIVGVFPVINKKPTNITINKHKYKKSSNSGSRSASPNTNLTVQNLSKVTQHKGSTAKRDDVKKKAEHVIMSSGEVKDNELDVNQIMKALKELEEMQSNIFLSSTGSPPPSNNRSSAGSSHTSPNSHGSASLKKPSAS